MSDYYSIRPVVHDGKMKNIEIVSVSFFNEIGDCLFEKREEAQEYYGKFWNHAWEKYEGWEAVKETYMGVKNV